MRNHSYSYFGIILFAVVIVIASPGYSGVVGDDFLQWKDDSFVGFFSPELNQASVDSIFNYFECIDYRVLGNQIVQFRVYANPNIDTIVDECNGLVLDSFIGAELSYVFSGDMEENLDKSAIPEELRPDCPSLGNEIRNQWYLNEDCLNVCEAWNTSLGADSDLIVVILDTGIDLGHEEFSDDIGYLDDGVDNRIEVQQISPMLPWQEPGMDYGGHGTQMAGIIGAPHNGFGIAGIAPECKIIIGDIGMCPFSATNPLECVAEGGELDVFDVVAGLAFVADLAEANLSKRFIVNTAWGYPLPSDNQWVMAMAIEIQRCADTNNVLFVAANGHPGFNKVEGGGVAYSSYPALFSGERGPYYSEGIDNIVVAVGATGYHSTVFGDLNYAIKAGDYTAWAAEDTCQLIADVSAPGGGRLSFGGPWLEIYSTTSRNNISSGYCYDWGTSLSCAQITGVAALAWSVNPEYSPESIKGLLRSWAKDSVVSDSGMTTKRYGATWGYNRFRGFRRECPLPIPDNPPVVWPNDNDKASGAGFPYDSWCSPVFGSGMPDARDIVNHPGELTVYRIYGGTLTENLNIVDADLVRVMGDLVIPTGITMEINSRDDTGLTRFVTYGGDQTNGGLDPGRVEVVVEDGGRIEVVDGNVEIVPKKYNSNPPGSWYGLILQPGSFFGNCSVLPDLKIIDSAFGLKVESSQVYISNLWIQTPGYGLRLNEDLTLNGINISGNVGDGPIVGVTLEEDSRLALIQGGEITSNNQVGAGLYLYDNAEVSVGSGSLVLDGFGYGLVLFGGGQAQVGGDVNISNSGIGVSSFGDLNLSNGNFSVVGQAGGLGVTLNGGSVIHQGSGEVSISNCDIGIKGEGDVVVEGNIQIFDSLIYGVLIENSNSSLVEGVRIEGAAQDGIRLSQTIGAMISGVELINNQGAGIGVYGYSGGSLRGSILSGNSSGLFVDGTSEYDAGIFYPASEHGENTFSLQGMFGMVNLNNSVVVNGEGNTWLYKGTVVCPPNPSKFIGWVSTICQ